MSINNNIQLKGDCREIQTLVWVMKVENNYQLTSIAQISSGWRVLVEFDHEHNNIEMR
jgi:hypothetical protein